MAQAIDSSWETSKGRGRGLLVVWRRELEKKLQINRYLPGRSRGATLAIMANMDQCPGRRPGWIGKLLVTLTIWIASPLGLEYQQTGPRGKEIPQRWPITWPRCLGRGTPTCSFRLLSPTPSTTFSDSLGPPSLESLTDPELGYEALVSSTLSSDTD